MEYQPLIRDLPLSERPRERLKALGASALSNAELLAIVLRTGTTAESVLSLATRLLAKFGGLGGLCQAGFAELAGVKGMGEAKACQIQASLALGKRLLSLQPADRVQVHSAQDVANLLMGEMSFLSQEQLRVVLLDTKNQVVSISPLYQGSVHTSIVRVSEVYREAIRQNCPALIVVHNHPSGDPSPSQEDIQITGELVAAGKLLDIELLDHLIIGQQRFVSLRERGLGFG